jgi:hypothetical protein
MFKDENETEQRPRSQDASPVARRHAVARVVLIPGILILSLSACGPRRLNVMRTPDQTLMAVGYSAERSQSIIKADDEAQEYCQREKKTVAFIKQDTIYQGQYDETLTSAGRVAGRVAGSLGSTKAANASRALSSPTDYKTTFEFRCQ